MSQNVGNHEYHSSIDKRCILSGAGAGMPKPNTNKEKQNKDESINILLKMEEL